MRCQLVDAGVARRAPTVPLAGRRPQASVPPHRLGPCDARRGGPPYRGVGRSAGRVNGRTGGRADGRSGGGVRLRRRRRRRRRLRARRPAQRERIRRRRSCSSRPDPAARHPGDRQPAAFPSRCSSPSSRLGRSAPPRSPPCSAGSSGLLATRQGRRGLVVASTRMMWVRGLRARTTSARADRSPARRGRSRRCHPLLPAAEPAPMPRSAERHRVETTTAVHRPQGAPQPAHALLAGGVPGAVGIVAQRAPEQPARRTVSATVLVGTSARGRRASVADAYLRPAQAQSEPRSSGPERWREPSAWSSRAGGCSSASRYRAWPSARRGGRGPARRLIAVGAGGRVSSAVAPLLRRRASEVRPSAPRSASASWPTAPGSARTSRTT